MIGKESVEKVSLRFFSPLHQALKIITYYDYYKFKILKIGYIYFIIN